MTDNNNFSVICGFEYGSIKAHAINTLNLANAFSRVLNYNIHVFVKKPKTSCFSDVWSNEFSFIDNLDLIQYSSLE